MKPFEDELNRQLSNDDRDNIYEQTTKRFEDAWQQADDPSSINLAAFLPETAGALRALTLVGLVMIDMEQRRKRGERLLVESYRERFAELNNDDFLLELAGWEYQISGQQGDTLDDLCHRFPTLAERMRRMLPPPVGLPKLELPEHLAGPPDPVLLEKGGMGIVLRAHDAKCNRTVAVKLLTVVGGDDAKEALRRFNDEIEVLNGLNHPGIVKVLDAARTHLGRPYYVMEFCRGGSLQARLRQHTLLPPREAGALVRRLADIMQAVHAKKIFHRDLKPGNILLEQTPDEPLLPETAKIADFGLAKVIDPSRSQLQSQSKALVGTPYYMAPEQIAGSPVTAATDVYALGVVLYECLTSSRPFLGATESETFDAIRHKEPPSPRLLNPKVNRDLETICLKCLEKEAKRRYPGASELVDDLGRFLAGEPIRARPISRLERARKWCRRYPAKAMLIVVFSVTIMVTFAWLLALNDQAQDRAKFADERLKVAEEQAEKDLVEARRKQSETQRLLEVERRINEDLREAVDFRDKVVQEKDPAKVAKGFDLATAAVIRARARAASHEISPDLEQQIAVLSALLEREQNERKFLERILHSRVPDGQLTTGGTLSSEPISKSKLAKVFMDNGLDLLRDDPKKIRAYLSTKFVREEAVQTLDDWMTRIPAQFNFRRSEENPSVLNVAKDLSKAMMEWNMVAANQMAVFRLWTVANELDSSEIRMKIRHAVFWQKKSRLLKLAREIRVEDHSPATWKLLGRGLLAAGENKEAIRALSRARDRYPNDFWLNYDLALFHLAPLVDNDTAQSAAPEEALRFATVAVSLHPEFAHGHALLGAVLGFRGKFEDAEFSLREALRLSPDHYDANILLAGLLWEKRGNPKEAEKHLRRAVKAQPQSAMAHLGLGTVLAAQLRWKEAEAEFRLSLQHDDSDPGAKVGLGNAILSQTPYQDPGLKSTFGSVKLKAGFEPFPFSKPLTAGGELISNKGGIKAHIAKRPDFILDYEAGQPPLYIGSVSKLETTLLVQLPDGKFVANDKGLDGKAPLLKFAAPQSGRYVIWVGTIQNRLAPATLMITNQIGNQE